MRSEPSGPGQLKFRSERRSSVTIAFLLMLVAAFGPQRTIKASEPVESTVIINAQVADGTGAPLRRANVRISADRIAEVGTFTPRAAERVVDAKGLVLAPGFIDIHNHSEEGLQDDPLAKTQISQGITTAILDPDGFSPWPIGAWLDARRKNPAAMNLAFMVGHATVRTLVMGEDYRRTATGAETEKMAQLVEQAMREGAIGLSSGLEYDVASYSSTDEVVALAAVASRHHGFYMTHIRDEADKAFEALEEEIAIGERAHIPVEHSHIKLGTLGVWGKAADYVRIIDAARTRGVDFLADCYPYVAWSSNIKVLVPDKQYENPASVRKALDDVGGASRVTIVDFPPSRTFEQHTIEEVAQSLGKSPVDAFIQIIRAGDAVKLEAGVVVRAMTEADLRTFYGQPWVMVASDGGIGARHPRGAGTFPRVLGLFVRQKQWLSLPESIRKMTSLPAQRLGWKDRGIIREGAYADLVLFNPRTVTDRSTFSKPAQISTGIESVFVNGTLVWNHDRPTGARPGRVLSEAH